MWFIHGSCGGGCANKEGFLPGREGKGREGVAPPLKVRRDTVLKFIPAARLDKGGKLGKSTPPCVQLGSLEPLQQERQLSREWWDWKVAPGAAGLAGSADMKSSYCLGRP